MLLCTTPIEFCREGKGIIVAFALPSLKMNGGSAAHTLFQWNEKSWNVESERREK